MTVPVALIERLTHTTRETIRPLLRTPLALVDFPNHSNPGDSAIWLGELACLRSLGMRPAYVCDLRTYSPERLDAAVGRGTILLHGGGNLGDLWPAHQSLRERVLADFPEHAIVQLPQSVHFDDPAALARARRALSAHRHLTVLARDTRSLDILTDALDTRATMCPDMAFCLGPLRRPVEATRDVLWLMRGDRESARMDARAGTQAVDWLGDVPSLLQTVGGRLAAYAARPSWIGGAAARASAATFAPMARRRVARGCRLLSEGRVVVSDRLHAHILCLLLGIPHVLLDNSYGKLRSFRDSWTADTTLARWAGSLDEAAELAHVA
jgi:pyruvyl transferase EpsO